MTRHPIIILTRPQLGENIGAAARVMANFGLSELRLVAPRDGWPGWPGKLPEGENWSKAVAMAAGAESILEKATVSPTLREAIGDCQLAIATTARSRRMNKPWHDVRDGVMQITPHISTGQRVAIVFGPERAGLENDEVTLCDQVISAPVNPDFPSLNLAQCVGIICHEWRQQWSASQQEQPIEQDVAEIAPKEALLALYDHLERELDAARFWKTEEKKPRMRRNILNMLQRAEFTEQEVQTWRGIITALTRHADG